MLHFSSLSLTRSLALCSFWTASIIVTKPTKAAEKFQFCASISTLDSTRSRSFFRIYMALATNINRSRTVLNLNVMKRNLGVRFVCIRISYSLMITKRDMIGPLESDTAESWFHFPTVLFYFILWDFLNLILIVLIICQCDINKWTNPHSITNFPPLEAHFSWCCSNVGGRHSSSRKARRIWY